MPEHHASADLATPDLRKATRVVNGREQLEVLAEAEILELGALGEPDATEIDHAADTRAAGDVSCVDHKAVGDVEHRVRVGCELSSFDQAQRRTREAVAPKRCAAGPEWARDDERVSGASSATAGNALRAPERGHAEHYVLGSARVAADDRHTGLVQALVERKHVVELGLARQPDCDDERLRLGARGGEIAEVDGRSAKAELLPAQPVEPEVDPLDERILGDDQAGLELSRVVFDLDGEPALFELGQQPELTELREPHGSRSRRGRD